MTITKSSNRTTFIGISLILILLVLFNSMAGSLIFHLMHIKGDTVTSIFVSRLILWLYLGLLFLYCRQVERRPLLIWQENKYGILKYFLSVTALLAICLAGTIMINMLLSLNGHIQHSSKMQEMLTIFRSNKPLLIFTAFTAGVVEELIFRGYLQPRFEMIFHKPWIAILLSSLIFGLMHYKYGTLRNIITPIFIGFIFSLYYSRYRNIKVLILCHFLWDFIVLTIQAK